MRVRTKSVKSSLLLSESPVLLYFIWSFLLFIMVLFGISVLPIKHIQGDAKLIALTRFDYIFVQNVMHLLYWHLKSTSCMSTLVLLWTFRNIE